MTNLNNVLEKYGWVIIILLCVPSFWSILQPGFFGISDDVHIAWLFEMDKVIRYGQIPPRYVPDLSYGFGYPLFNFVFPLPFYIAEVFHLLGLTLVGSIEMVFLISTFLSGITMFLFLRQLTNSSTSLLGSILYVYTPYRATDIYIRGAIGEIVAFVFLPLILFSTFKLITQKDNNLRFIALGGIALAALFLSHNITTYMFMPFLILFALLLSFVNHKRIWVSLSQFLAMVVTGSLISLYFWLPALLESNLMKFDTVFNFADHFPTLKQLFTPYWGYGASVAGPYDGLSFFQGGINIVIIIFGLIGLIFFWRKIQPVQKAVLVWVYLTYLSSLFMMNYRSSLIWENLPLLNYFQFPWRFLIMVTLITPVTLIIINQLKVSKIYSIFLSGVLISLIITLSTPMFRPEEFLQRNDEYFLNRYIPVPIVGKEYLEHQEEYLRLPKAAQMRPDKLYPPAFSDTRPNMQLNIVNDLYTIVKIDVPENLTLSFNKYYFPGWEAKVDGMNTTVKAAPPFGQISLDLNKGYHQVEVKFSETPFRTVLNCVSLLSWLIALILLSRSFKKNSYE